MYDTVHCLLMLVLLNECRREGGRERLTTYSKSMFTVGLGVGLIPLAVTNEVPIYT
jgi:hypothetical protein